MNFNKSKSLLFRVLQRLLFLLLCFYSLSIFSQSTNFLFKQISFEQGLPGVNVRKQFQDKDGIMWIALEATGLCRYDGHKFRLYKNIPENNNSIPSNFVNDVCEDKQGNIWIATEEGLCSLNKKVGTFKNYFYNNSDQNSISDNLIYTVINDVENNIWIGTRNGLTKFSNNKFQRYIFKYNDTFEINTTLVYSILDNNDGNLWLGTNRGLLKFNCKTGNYKQWEKTGETNNEPIFNRIIDIKKDRNDVLWIGTHRGLDRFDTKNERFIHWQYNLDDLKELASEGIYSIYIDKDKYIWVGTYTKGIILINQKDNTYIKIRKDDGSKFPLKSDHIRFIFCDKTGIIWVGTKFEGLFKYDDNKGLFDNWPTKYSLLKKIKNKHVLAFYEDKDICWVGSKYEGLFKVDLKQQKITNYQHQEKSSNSISSNRIQCIYRDSKNNLWVGTENGLDILNETNNTFSRIYNNTTYKVLEDFLGTIWCGTSKGVFKYDKITNTLIRHNDTGFKNFFLNDNMEIICLSEDSKHYLWFSSRYRGLFMYQPQTKEGFHFINHPQRLNDIEDNMARQVFEDHIGNIWIGTKTKGLKKYDRETKSFTTYNELNGLPSNLILSIEEDKNNNLWIATYNGLSKFNPFNLTIDNFNTDYGLQSNISELGLSWRFAEGYLLFGGVDGFNIFDPKDIIKNTNRPDIAITSVRIFDKEIAMDITRYKEIELSHKQNYISFEFTLTDYNYPHRHKYLYYLKGIDNTWKDADKYNIASYTSLKPGEYFFSVKGINERGNMSRKPLTIKITIHPAFYSTWLFRILIMVILILTGYFIYTIKSRQIISTRIYLETQIKERTQKLEDAYQELLAKNQMIEEKTTEIELHRSQLEETIKERTRDLETAKQKAEDSDKLKSAFLANMSHEIRTPLNAIIGFSFLLNDHSITDEERENYLNIINNNTNSLLKLIEDILDISKIEAGQLNIKNDFFDLNSLFYELYSVFHEELKTYKKNMAIKLICTNPLKDAPYLPVFADQLRIKQIMINLLSNAVKYTNAGEIEFGYKIIKNDVEFYVKDTGIGISEKDQEVVFNQFVKVEQQTSAYRGTGLGLSISKSLVELMGGRITLESEPGVGSCFKVYIPGIIDKMYVAQLKQKSSEEQYFNFTDKTILLVEDEESNLRLLKSYFKKSGAIIETASDGIEAIEKCKTERIDLILMDIKMPRLNGFDAIKILKKEFPDIPVIAQTAYAMVEDRQKIYEAGFDNYIAKPIKKDKLFEILSVYM